LYKKFFKRVLDILFSLLLIIIFLPLYLIIGLLVLIIDRNKIIFKQERTGLNGKTFIIYKFSTYKNNNISKLGSILRSLSLDELPQFYNVLKGDMSFVGPRPWILDYYNNMDNYQKRRVSVLPGIIGLAQVNGRNSIDIFKKIDYDLKYVDNISFILDLKIVIKSILVIFNKNDNSFTKGGIEKEINSLKKNNLKKK